LLRRSAPRKDFYATGEGEGYKKRGFASLRLTLRVVGGNRVERWLESRNYFKVCMKSSALDQKRRPPILPLRLYVASFYICD